MPSGLQIDRCCADCYGKSKAITRPSSSKQDYPRSCSLHLHTSIVCGLVLPRVQGWESYCDGVDVPSRTSSFSLRQDAKAFSKRT